MTSPRRPIASLRRELLLSTAALFVAALLVAVAAAAVTLPLLQSPAQAALFIALLVGVDLAILFFFLRGLFQTALLDPVEQIGADAERIAGGDLSHRIAAGGGEELDRLARSLNTMAERLIAEQERLAESVRSLDQANRDLVSTTDELVRSARMASVGTLAAGLAHEVGNPLGALVGYLDVARGRITSGGDLRSPLESAQEEAGRIDRIVRSILDFADPRGGRGAPREGPGGSVATVSMVEVIERTLQLLEGRGALSGVAVRHENSPGEYLVRARPQHLEQILMNLLMNARRAAREGTRQPEVSLRLSAGSGAARVSSGEGAGGGGTTPSSERMVILEIADSGPGIRKEDLERIFDPFFTTRAPGEGTGLGLAITQRIVRELGGRIEARQRDQGGALFVVYLPEASRDRLNPSEPADIRGGEAG